MVEHLVYFLHSNVHFKVNTNSTITHESDWIPWVVIGIAVVIFFTLVFLMVAVSNRGWRPSPGPGDSWSYY